MHWTYASKDAFLPQCFRLFNGRGDEKLKKARFSFRSTGRQFPPIVLPHMFHWKGKAFVHCSPSWYARVRKLHFPLKRVAGFNNCIASIYPSDLNIYSGYHKALSPVSSQWSIAYPSHEWNVVEVRCCCEPRAWSFRFLFPSFQFSPASKLVQLWIIRASGDFGCGFSGFAFVTRRSLWVVLGWYWNCQ